MHIYIYIYKRPRAPRSRWSSPSRRGRPPPQLREMTVRPICMYVNVCICTCAYIHAYIHVHVYGTVYVHVAYYRPPWPSLHRPRLRRAAAPGSRACRKGGCGSPRSGSELPSPWVFRDVVLQDVGVHNTSCKPLAHISFRCEVPIPSVFEGQ